MKLVIVESPAKCAKIQGFLGDGYKVQATMGHIRALDETLDSVGIDRGWEPTYKEIATKRDAITKLRAAAKGCEVILASDDDREGEGIAWHVCFILKLNPATTQRIVFHEITKPAILAAVAHPRTLDLHKVNAQQARAMLDLLVGFTISKVLWNRVAPKLSAGRCQTPALRLVVERDAEVENHRAAAYWRLRGTFKASSYLMLEAQAADDLNTQDEATTILQKVHKNTRTTIASVKESVSISNPPKPLITSTLQQEASSAHGLSPKVTMQAAQKLYEAGHITYMRTDNAVLSQEAAMAIRAYIETTHGAEYLGPLGTHTIVAAAEGKVVEADAKAPKKKTAKKAAKDTPAAPEAQAAHEAIRPTHPEEPEPLIADPTQKTVYRLIWRRATQCQMNAAQTDVRKVTLELDADKGRAWNTEQTKTKFLGWRALENQNAERAAADEAAWAAGTAVLKKDALLNWTSLAADEQFTKPKGRYTEASLIAELEKRGIGRPSTFATLVSTIIDRDYVEKTNVEGKAQDSHHYTLSPNSWPPALKKESHKVGAEKNKLRSTPLGRSVSDFLGREYSDLFNYEFTAGMEQSLDDISKGTKPWKSLLQETWDTYKERYAEQSKGGAAAKAAKERELAPGVKIILSRKGPLFVKDPPEGSPKTTKVTFAAVPPTLAFEDATAADAETAFAGAAEARAGELLGDLDGAEIRKKKGPYGYYAECKGYRIPLKEGDDELGRIKERFVAKISLATGTATDVSGASVTAYDRKVGDFTIKRGPYGLYFFKHTLKRATFVKFPPAADPDKTTVADLSAYYSDGINKKKRGGWAKKGAAAAATEGP
jgi:DNA topoisomerase-1